ncbi:hypothetical protein SK128_025399, partial [Halocaridina rubra]
MLPSTSSPVESASVPASLTETLSCSPDYLTQKKGVHVADLKKENVDIPSKGDFHLYSPQSNHEEGCSSSVHPPDLCSESGQEHQHSFDPHKRSSLSSEEDVDDTIAQAVCDTKFVTSLSHINDPEQNILEENEALGIPSSKHLEDEHAMETESTLPPINSVSLPDLCDTRRGSHSKHLLDSGALKTYERDTPGESERESSHEANVESENHNIILCETEPVAGNSKDRVESESYSVDSCDEDNLDNRLSADEMVDENVESDGTCESNILEESDIPKINEGDCVSSTDDGILECASSEIQECMGPVEDYLVHDNQQISLVACGITHCNPSSFQQQDVEMTEVTEEEQGIHLIRHNLHHSSHPMFLKWPCLFYITEEHLPSFSIDSHGRHIGS